MNAIGMIAHQGGQQNLMTKLESVSKSDTPSIFEGMLVNAGTKDSVHITDKKMKQGNLMDKQETLAQMDLDVGILIQMFNGLIPKKQANEKLEKLEGIFQNLSVNETALIEGINISGDTEAIHVKSLLGLLANDSSAIAHIFQQQLQSLMRKAEGIIKQAMDYQDIPKHAASLLKILEKWIVLQKQSDGNLVNKQQTIKNPIANAIWQHLVQTYQKRNQLAQNRQYNINAKVTSADVAKWLENALHNQLRLDSSKRQELVPAQQAMPMSKVEQYIIYINQTQGSKAADQQLIDQFQKVIKLSNFLQLNGSSQLSLTLKPDNLGEMMVKLTQINGEMTVKILVTSQVAKDMLESNMHQLRHMFSPQQVVIDRQDINSSGAQSFQNDEEKQSMNNHKQGQSQSKHSDDNKSQQQQPDDFESEFIEALLNRKV